jgi:pSer/pThr/pTyr-binding forkhead associated (FHA) protein
MAPTQPFSSPHAHPPYPSLYLYPLNDTFIPKHISLHNGQRVKIGRQTNTKTIPGERNGYFDSKVLSRQHAEIWEDSGKVRLILYFSGQRPTDVAFRKIYIKDVKSSNGTFINGERLSPEGVESDPFELKNDDIVVCFSSLFPV